jgi:phosphatidylserine/phosphatidylglycerophosphate/cardiolipin synthase-like enzyme
MSIEQHYSNPVNLTPVDTATLGAAAKTIDFAAYSLTEPTVISTLLARAQAGVQIRIYLDRSEVEAEARGNAAMPTSALHTLFNIPNVQIKVKESIVLMHLKSYLVDGTTLRTGSANFSTQGEFEQDNDLILTDDAATIAAFEAKFGAMWARPDNLSVAAAITQAHTAGHTAGHVR